MTCLMKTFKRLNFTGWILPLLLILVSSYLMGVNHVSGTWLTGWDTLHPEFDFKLNFWRMFNGVWREDQGLGTLAAHSHMSELPRLLVLWILSWLLPLNTVRYVLMAICFILGPLGVYFLVRGLMKENKNPQVVSLGAFLAGLFYIFNLGTVQHFYVMFEMFAVAYAALPWLFFIVYRFALTGQIRWLGWLALVSFLASPMAYASTLWFASITGLGLFLVGLRCGGKRLVQILLVMLAVNAYWLLPNLYYLGSDASKAVLDAKINQLFSNESFLHNKAYGNFLDILLLKNFLFNWQVYDFPSHQFVSLLGEWQKNSQQFAVLGMGLMAVMGVGIWLSFKHKVRWRWALLLPMGVAMLMLVTDNPPFGTIFGLLREKLPFLGEALRTPFTKFSLILMLSFSVYFGAGFGWLVMGIKNDKWRKIASGVVSLILITGMFVWGKPAFQGQLVSQRIQLTIPQPYFKLYEFLKSKPTNARIALLPMPSLFGWEYNSWGYQGAGFLWFGMRQPILMRDFDRWSPYNEGFYQEASTALYSKDFAGLGEVLKKYQVPLVLVEDSIMDPQAVDTGIGTAELKLKISDIGAEMIWQDDNLSLYEIPENLHEGVWGPEKYTMAKVETDKVRVDNVYQELGDYIEADKVETVQYPLSGLMKEKPEGVQETDRGLELTREMGPGGSLVVPGMQLGQEVEIKATAKYQDGQVTVEFVPYLTIEGGENPLVYRLAPMSIPIASEAGNIAVELGGEIKNLRAGEVSDRFGVKAKIGQPIAMSLYGASGEEMLVSEAFKVASLYPCWERTGKKAQVSEAVLGEERQISVRDGSGCISVYLGKLTEEEGLATITVPYQSTADLKPHFCVNRAEDPTHTCLHEEVYSQTQTSPSGAEVSRQFKVEPGANYWVDMMVRPPEAEGTSGTLSYLPPKLLISPLIQTIQVESNAWEDWLRVKSTPIKGNDLKIVMETEPVIVDLSAVGKTQAENCDLFKRGEVEKEGNRYLSWDRGAGCDGTRLSNLSNQEEYLMAVRSNNVSGRPLKIYLRNNASQRNDLETLLPKGEGKSLFSILSWPGIKAADYSLNLENRSFGREVAENRLEPIKFYSVPLRWLAGIKVMPEGDTNDNLKIKNNLKITEVDKIGTGYYKVSAEGDGLLALSQGFDKAWVAVSNGKLLEHIKVNGWQNGWMVPGSGKVMIVYWPQFLEWLGLGILVLVSVGFGVIFLKHGVLPVQNKTTGGDEL